MGLLRQSGPVIPNNIFLRRVNGLASLQNSFCLTNITRVFSLGDVRYVKVADRWRRWGSWAALAFLSEMSSHHDFASLQDKGFVSIEGVFTSNNIYNFLCSHPGYYVNYPENMRSVVQNQV